MNIQSIFIHKNHKLEITQLLTNFSKNKQVVVHPSNLPPHKNDLFIIIIIIIIIVVLGFELRALYLQSRHSSA
jgi:hypothetical protein